MNPSTLHSAYAHPLFAPLWPWLKRCAASAANSDNVASQLNALMGATPLCHQVFHHRLHFVAPNAAASGLMNYEQRISERGEIETRNQAHDFFGGLVWLCFPASKSAINALHQQALQAPRVRDFPPGGRGQARDFLTLFDEGGMIWLQRDNATLPWALWLQQHEWTTMFVRERAAFKQDIVPLLFGHAIYEKGLAPYPAITARCLIVSMPECVVQALKSSPHDGAYQQALMSVDQALAKMLLAGCADKQRTWQPRDLLPLPIFALPDWADNADESFFANTAIFRPAPAKNLSGGLRRQTA